MPSAKGSTDEINFFETGYISETVYKPLQNQCGQIRRMLISSLNTTKANQGNK